MNNKNTARDFFLYLFATAALYFSSIAFITLLWQYINHFFPEANQAYYDGYISGPMRFAISSLIIIFPIYVFVAWWLGRDMDKHPDKQGFAVRRWLIYITLFVTSVTIVVDLITILNQLLEGDFVLRFILKALAILLVAVAVFAYYIFTLRRQPGAKRETIKLIVWVTSIVVAVAVIGGFFVIGSPSSNRELQYDNARVNDLSNIQREILNYTQTVGEIPASLEDLEDDFGYFTLPKDPETNESYEYKVLDAENLSFQLCASFIRESEDGENQTSRVSKPTRMDTELSEIWTHSQGRTCFERSIDPERHPFRDM